MQLAPLQAQVNLNLQQQVPVLFEFGSQSGEHMAVVLKNVRAAKGRNSAAKRTSRVTFSSAAAQSLVRN